MFICLIVQAFNQPIEGWDVGNVTNMSRMFYNAKYSTNQLKVGMLVMLQICLICLIAETFNQPIEGWNVGNVTDMSGMFSCAETFNQPIEGWDVGNVTDMSCMFYHANIQPTTRLERW